VPHPSKVRARHPVQQTAEKARAHLRRRERALDEEVSAFRDRSLAAAAFPYVFLDATYCKARVNRRVVSQAIVVATRVCAGGRREVLGVAVGDSEDRAFWTAFPRSLKARGLAGVQLVISDAHIPACHSRG
jgi:transposase-like protein